MRKDSGMGLISVLVATAIGGIVVAGMASAIAEMYAAQKRVSRHAEWNGFVTGLDRMLQDNSKCTAALAGEKFEDLTGAPTTLNAVTIKLPWNDGQYTPTSKSSEIKAGTPIARGLQLENVHLEEYEPTDVPITIKLWDPAKLKLVTHKRQLMRIKISGREVRPGKIEVVKGVQFQARDLFVPVLWIEDFATYPALNAGTTKTIAGCHTQASAADACIAAGGSWTEIDPKTSLPIPDEQRCKPASVCHFGGIFTESLSKPAPKPIHPNTLASLVDPSNTDGRCPAGYSKHKISENYVATYSGGASKTTKNSQQTITGGTTAPVFCGKYGCSTGSANEGSSSSSSSSTTVAQPITTDTEIQGTYACYKCPTGVTLPPP